MASKTRSKLTPEERAAAREHAGNPVWYKPLMIGFMIVGLLWIIVFYLSGASLPIPGLNSWNILIGFAIAFVGFLMTTRWK
ncbi:cell division protein CrgA [Gryllotalpicola protaetiae]|uniref:Cell division protein CrgA n=1 Tax=Gryllotalpicola protaetiae TaxID=2419771 RepID=A0A387BNG6_9MICO|nr:cell division protein CrgA [Gryllotalpicola protaetiae]AYG03564.1 cell division protein CrgA [Gryllotalpicola protaetiae]